MRVLIVKTSSLGDIIHTFPALTDAAKSIPGIRFDWVVEESFTELPAMHPTVDRIIPSAMRRWRKSWLKTWRGGEWRDFINELNKYSYDAVIDAQGLIKSALITRKVKAISHGLDKISAREPLASRFYQHRHHIPRQQHAITRVRQLFAAVLAYDLPDTPPAANLNIGIDKDTDPHSIFFLHGTTWPSKQWPLSFWQELAQQLERPVLVTSANKLEAAFARELTQLEPNIQNLPQMSLPQIAQTLNSVAGVVSVDTGLAHLTAALQKPQVSLYGATDTGLTGITGGNQISLTADIDCSPCFKRECPKLKTQLVAPCTQTLSPKIVAEKLNKLLG